jgi:hypothetical protein
VQQKESLSIFPGNSGPVMDNTNSTPPRDGRSDDIGSTPSANALHTVESQSQSANSLTHNLGHVKLQDNNVASSGAAVPEPQSPLAKNAIPARDSTPGEIANSLEDEQNTSPNPSTSRKDAETTNFDNIETVPVEDDPRKWSASRKVSLLLLKLIDKIRLIHDVVDGPVHCLFRFSCTFYCRDGVST